MIAYKLTDPDGYTRRGDAGETLWLPASGQVVAPLGEGREACGPGVIHYYATTEEAVLYDPLHADHGPGARAIEIEVADDAHDSDGLKHWTWKAVRVLREVSLTTISIEERVAWAICLGPHSTTRSFAVTWLSGRDRTASAGTMSPTLKAEQAAAEAAVVAATHAAWAAAWATRTAETALAAEENGRKTFPLRSLAALTRARAILEGTFPAERYDDPLLVA